MSRYIDADARIKKVFPYDVADPKCYSINAKAVYEEIRRSPAADVVEVRHGTWYHVTKYGVGYAKCSACGRKMDYSCYGYAYCALCGAKMDGERSEE